jgi:type I restriction enzyme, R subunit
MPADRPAIPSDVCREVLFQARHRCAVCCEPIPLEYAHIIPWRKTKDHSEPNLIALCANCHGRADKESWGAQVLKRYKVEPCALAIHRFPPMSSEQRAMVDIIVGSDPDSMSEKQRQRLISMFAAYAGVKLGEVELISVTPANSARVRLRMPAKAARRIVEGFETRDPQLQRFMDDFDLLDVELVPTAGVNQRTTDVSEQGLETLIVRHLTHVAGYAEGDSKDYDRDHAVDLAKLLDFLRTTQPEVVEQFGLANDGPERLKFLNRLQGEVARQGIVEVLRKGIKHGPLHIDFFYGAPSARNIAAAERYAANVFSVTRQFRYSKDETRLSLDLALFINGLPVCTFELKNNLTKQTVHDAIDQYKRDRDERELLFQFGRCMVHFAVDDQEVWFCTHLKGKASWFLPFNKGYRDGAGNPPNPYGLKTDYLWRDILTRSGLTEIIENYAQITEERDERTGRRKRRQIFPRYHQLDVVRELLADATKHGAGRRYLIQHSAGSGKSNSIAWTAHQLVGLKLEGAPSGRDVFDSVIVVTDRRVLDKQLRNTIKQFAQVGSIVGAVTEGSGQLRRFIEQGKKIIISTVQKFPYILSEIGDEHRDRTFAILIDEAHSSQGGKTAAAMSEALTSAVTEEDPEDTVNAALERRMASRKLMQNASYFAFTATPKNKTLELFGRPEPQPDGTIKHRAFHPYTMKQAIEEGFILDVLQNYTPIASYYRLEKAVEDDPEYDVKKAQKKLRRYVEGHEHAVRQKAEIMVDHFHDQVIAQRKVGGEARAMVVTGSIERAIKYFHAIEAYLKERRSPFRAVVAFSDTVIDGEKVTEAQLNGFPSALIEEKIREDPYRFLVVADKFQTGYDEPLLHTMYVDKQLSGVKAVQTLSRLNRAHPAKHDTFILDFSNDADTIRTAFEPYYRTTILAEETDPNKLHDLKASLDGHQVYAPEDVDALAGHYLSGAERDRLDPILDAAVANYNDLGEDEQVDFKGKARAFVRTYDFLASVLPYNNADWEKLSIFLRFLVPKLPTPVEEDMSKGVLETIDMESYRAEAQAKVSIALADEDAEIDPIPVSGGGRKDEPEIDVLSNIVRAFNDQFGNIEWKDADKIQRVISEELPERVAADEKYRNAMANSDKQNARIEHDRALRRIITEMVMDQTELYKQFNDNASFHKWLADTIFAATYATEGAR